MDKHVRSTELKGTSYFVRSHSNTFKLLGSLVMTLLQTTCRGKHLKICQRRNVMAKGSVAEF